MIPALGAKSPLMIPAFSGARSPLIIPTFLNDARLSAILRLSKRPRISARLKMHHRVLFIFIFIASFFVNGLDLAPL